MAKICRILANLYANQYAEYDKNIIKNMQTRSEYAEYWQVYILHIGNISALPTLLMEYALLDSLHTKYII